jgi:hypothetical protein
MRFEGAVIREQGQSFAIVIVNSTLQMRGDSALQDTAISFGRFFPGIPVVLMWQDSRGIPTYWGRKDIVAFLAKLHISQIPWQRFSVAA